MSVVSELESRVTALEKEIFLSQLRDEILTDLFLIYGNKGHVSREGKIVLIAHCKKTVAEKLSAVKRFLISAQLGKNFFSTLNDSREFASWTRTFNRLRTWKKNFELGN